MTSRSSVTFETDRFGNIDCLVPGSHGPSVKAIAFKTRSTVTPPRVAYNVHDIAKGGQPVPTASKGGAIRIMLRMAGVDA